MSCAVIVACARDPLEEAAWQASRAGTAAGQGRGGMDTVGLEAGSRVVERFYYVAKYQASLGQRRFTETSARKIARRPLKRASTTRGKPGRYLAVRTRSDARATTRTSVMLWDTFSSEIVGNDVYDLNEAPPTGAMVKFETYTAEFVGSGG